MSEILLGTSILGNSGRLFSAIQPLDIKWFTLLRIIGRYCSLPVRSQLCRHQSRRNGQAARVCTPLNRLALSENPSLDHWQREKKKKKFRPRAFVFVNRSWVCCKSARIQRICTLLLKTLGDFYSGRQVTEGNLNNVGFSSRQSFNFLSYLVRPTVYISRDCISRNAGTTSAVRRR